MMYLRTHGDHIYVYEQHMVGKAYLYIEQMTELFIKHKC